MQTYTIVSDYGKYDIDIIDNIISIYDGNNKKHIVNINQYSNIFEGKDINTGIINSLLIELNENKYMHIDDSITCFKTDEKIIDYECNTINSYNEPLAYGTSNVYLLTEYVYFPCSCIEKNDVYKTYYDKYRSSDRKYMFHNDTDNEYVPLVSVSHGNFHSEDQTNKICKKIPIKCLHELVI